MITTLSGEDQCKHGTGVHKTALPTLRRRTCSTADFQVVGPLPCAGTAAMGLLCDYRIHQHHDCTKAIPLGTRKPGVCIKPPIMPVSSVKGCPFQSSLTQPSVANHREVSSSVFQLARDLLFIRLSPCIHRISCSPWPWSRQDCPSPVQCQLLSKSKRPRVSPFSFQPPGSIH